MPVAVVAAETEHIADDALALIEVEYEVLEPALDFLTAAERRQAVGQPAARHDPDAHGPRGRRRPERAMAEADVVVEHITTTPYEQHLPLELRTGLYYWEGDTLVTYQTTHRTFDVRRELARWLSLAEDQVRVIQTGFMGSSYGSADHIVEELVLPAVMARIIGRPVRSMLTREESFLTSAHRGRTRTRVKLGVNHTGELPGAGRRCPVRRRYERRPARQRRRGARAHGCRSKGRLVRVPDPLLLSAPEVRRHGGVDEQLPRRADARRGQAVRPVRAGDGDREGGIRDRMPIRSSSG